MKESVAFRITAWPLWAPDGWKKFHGFEQQFYLDI